MVEIFVYFLLLVFQYDMNWLFEKVCDQVGQMVYIILLDDIYKWYFVMWWEECVQEQLECKFFIKVQFFVKFVFGDKFVIKIKDWEVR